jgi:hypothetical protein
MNKEQAIELWMKKQNYRWTPEMVQDIQEKMDSLTIEKCKEWTGKKKKETQKAYQYILKNVEDGGNKLKDAAKHLYDEVEIRYQAYKQELEDIEKSLKEFSKSYVPETSPDMNCVKTSSPSDYRSQGWGASKYAKNALMEDYNLLQLLGYKAEIRFAPESETMLFDCWQLWTNLNQFNYDMVKMSGKFISVLNWAVLCWENGSNPKVYFPFLSNDDYEKSQVLAYHTKYKVTKENMMLELSWDEINEIR